MRLNLGCGPDVRAGYDNIDFRPVHGAEQVDLSKFPWPWRDSSADEILMLDFLEHFPYKMTETIIQEAWRVLSLGGHVDIQVPCFETCARNILGLSPIVCECEREFTRDVIEGVDQKCPFCARSFSVIRDTAVHRLYGGQNYPGNWHQTAFTRDMLKRLMSKNGFGQFEDLEYEHQYRNWNFKIRAKKIAEYDAWCDHG